MAVLRECNNDPTHFAARALDFNAPLNAVTINRAETGALAAITR
jgi:hypothetical protein